MTYTDSLIECLETNLMLLKEELAHLDHYPELTGTVISSTQSGFACFNGKYYFCSFAGWVSISGAKGAPYLFEGSGRQGTDHSRRLLSIYFHSGAPAF